MTPTITIIIISILCALIGVLAAYIFMNRPKKKSTNKPKSHREPVAEKPKMEFSKKIMIFSAGISIIILAFAMYIIYLGAVSGYGSDSTNLNVLLTGLMAQISASVSFYFWKSKQENIIKLESTYGRNVDETDTFSEPNDFNDDYPI